MRDIASQTGFHITGAMAVVTKHSVVRKIAAGRPDEADIQQIIHFGSTMQQLISQPADTIRNMKEPELPVMILRKPRNGWYRYPAQKDSKCRDAICSWLYNNITAKR